MAVKIFLTGATGYIGGDALFHLYKKHPEFEYALLVRSEDKAKKVVENYPTVRIVLGGLDDSEKLEREASWADIVIHTADSSDHAGAATAISKGLAQGHSASRPGFWLHTGGTGILTYFDSEVKKVFGEPDDKVFDDYEGVQELIDLPAAAFHRNVDEIVLATGREHADSVKTAVVCPPTIYGEGRGPVSGRGRQVYELAHFVLEQGYSPRIGRGLARWNNVHVRDLSAVFELLVEAALDPAREGDAAELWGARGYYFTENGEHVWGDLSEAVGREARAQGLLLGADAPEVRELSFDEALKSPAGFEAASWGMNSRGRAVRARKVLGWAPREGSLEDEVPAIVRSEAARAGIQRA
ncbi:NAD(P)-binding protein [Colletotrichum falcatum]|nr:NAD(P)-binding protein [Colletotrichum falcatum]